MTTAVEPAAPGRPAAEPIGRATWILVAIALVPLVVATVRLLTSLGSGFHATGDNALNELVMRDIGSHAVLTGPFSRGSWSHPGPLFFYVSWPVYRLAGANSTAMLIDALVINGLAIGVMITMAKRWGGLLLAGTVAVACGALVVTLPSGFLANPWNPYVTVLPFGAFVLAAWAATCGDRLGLALAVFIGSFCVQDHIGYAPIVLPLLVWCAWRVFRDRRSNGLTGLWWAIATAAVVWFPPVLDQLTRHPGNFHAIGSYFTHPDGPKHTIEQGLRIVAAQFTMHADWLRGFGGANPYTAEPFSAAGALPVPLLLLPFGAALVTAFVTRARRRVDFLLGIALLIPLVFGVGAVAQTIGALYEYRLRWVWVLAALTVAFTVAVLARAVMPRLPRPSARIAGGGLLVGVLTLSAVACVHIASIEPPIHHRADQVRDLSDQVIRNLPSGRGDVVIKTDTSFLANADLPGVILNLERASIPVRQRYDYPTQLIYGKHRIHRGGPIRARLILTSDTVIETVASLPGARRIAYVGDFNPRQRAAAVQRLAALQAAGAKPFSPAVLDAKRRINALAVFFVPATSF
ncbi:MAG: hypothetical protein ABJC79_04535 [Acidimicrobiia bacterium]